MTSARKRSISIKNDMEPRQLLRILRPYCRLIEQRRTHYVFFPLDKAIRPFWVGITPSDRNWHKHMFQVLKRHGMIVRELELMCGNKKFIQK